MLPRLTANDYSSWPRGDPPNLGAFCKARSHNHFGHFLSIRSMMKAGHGFSAEPRCLGCFRLHSARTRGALLWFAGINGTVGALDHEASVHVSARNVLSYFNFGLMGAVETRYNRVIIPVDFMWVQLKDSKGIPVTDDVQSVHAKINEDILTPKVGYRVVDNSRF